MQGSCESGSAGPSVRRAFARSRYEADYQSEAYDLLVQLGHAAAADLRPQEADSKISEPRQQEDLTHEDHKEHRHDYDPALQASSGLCACLL